MKPSDDVVTPPVRLYEVWIKTKELGWFRSAIRSSEEAANRVADQLRQNFEVDIRS